MKHFKKLAILAFVVLMFGAVDASAQSPCAGCPPPPPPGHGPGNSGVETPPGGCAPIDGGTAMLVLMGMAYAARKTYQLKTQQ